MIDVQKLTDDQREILARIRLAFQRDLEQAGPVEAYEVLAEPDDLDRVTIDTLHKLGPDYSSVVEFEPDPRSGYANGAEVLRDIETLQRDGVL